MKHPQNSKGDNKGGRAGSGGPRRPGDGPSRRFSETRPAEGAQQRERPTGPRTPEVRSGEFRSAGARSDQRAGEYRPAGNRAQSEHPKTGRFSPDKAAPATPRPASERQLRLPRDERPAAPADRLGRGREMHGGGQRGAPDAPRGAVWLYGFHAVLAALGNPARRLRRLVLTAEAEATLAEKLPQPWATPPERVERARIDHLLGRDAVHQGMALLADPLAPPTLAQVLERPGPILVLDQVTDPRNVGAILRSAAAFGTAAVITQERNAPEETGALAKAASGALESVPLLRAVNISRTLIALKAAGCWVVGLDASGAALNGPSLAQRRVALVLGSEGEGLRRLTRETCDELAGIGMVAASIDSLNVSAATAIALYEMNRRS